MRGSFKEHCFDFFLSPSADWAPPQVVVDVKCWHARSQPHVDSETEISKGARETNYWTFRKAGLF